MKPTVFLVFALLPVVHSAPEELTNHRPRPSRSNVTTLHIGDYIFVPYFELPVSSQHPSRWNAEDLTAWARSPEEKKPALTQNAAEAEGGKRYRDRRKKKKPKTENYHDAIGNGTQIGNDDADQQSQVARPPSFNATTLYVVMVKQTENETIIERVMVERIQQIPTQPSPSKTQHKEPFEQLVSDSVECIRLIESGKTQTAEESAKCPVIMYSVDTIPGKLNAQAKEDTERGETEKAFDAD